MIIPGKWEKSSFDFEEGKKCEMLLRKTRAALLVGGMMWVQVCVCACTRLHAHWVCWVAYIASEHILPWEIGWDGCIHEKQEATKDAFMSCLRHLVLPYRPLASDPNYCTLLHHCHSTVLQNTLYLSSCDCRRKENQLVRVVAVFYVHLKSRSHDFSHRMNSP